MPSRVVFYTKPGCHLCDDARGLLDAWAVSYEMVESDPRYELRVPVVELDGAVIADPFHRTEPLVELLSSRAAQLSATEALPRDIRSRRGSRGVFIARLRGNA